MDPSSREETYRKYQNVYPLQLHTQIFSTSSQLPSGSTNAYWTEPCDENFGSALFPPTHINSLGDMSSCSLVKNPVAKKQRLEHIYSYLTRNNQMMPRYMNINCILDARNCAKRGERITVIVRGTPGTNIAAMSNQILEREKFNSSREKIAYISVSEIEKDFVIACAFNTGRI